MSEKRFEVVLNEFDEVEYIMDKKLCEDKDFAEFMDFVEELAKENEQLKRQNKALKDSSLIDAYNQYIRTCTVQSNRE